MTGGCERDEGALESRGGVTRGDWLLQAADIGFETWPVDQSSTEDGQVGEGRRDSCLVVGFQIFKDLSELSG